MLLIVLLYVLLNKILHNIIIFYLWNGTIFYLTYYLGRVNLLNQVSNVAYVHIFKIYFHFKYLKLLINIKYSIKDVKD